MPNYSNEEQQVLTKEMSDKIYNDSYSTTEEELVQDTNWIEASKAVYQELEGAEWSGSDEDLAKKGLDMMSRFNYNLTLGTINYTAKLQDANPQTKLSFYYMMDMYDKKDISGNGVLRAFKEMGLDPASYIGIGTLGMGFAGKQAAATAAKTGLKSMLKQGAIKFLQSPTAVAATEGAIYTGVDDVARQDAAIGAGVQDEYSPGQTAVATGIGAVAGAGFVKGGQALGRGITKAVNEQENVLRKNFEEGGSMAGGGTPPKMENVDTFEGYRNEILDVYESVTGSRPEVDITDKTLNKRINGAYELVMEKAEDGTLDTLKGGKETADKIINLYDRYTKEFNKNKSKFLRGSILKTPVYHGTNVEFDEFVPKKGYREGGLSQFEVESPAFFFTESNEVAREFGGAKADVLGGNYFRMDNYISLKKPLDMTRKNKKLMQVLEDAGFDSDDIYGSAYNIKASDLWAALDEPEVVNKLKKMGYDGAIVNEGKKMGKSYAVFNPNQIKSIYNKGDFDKTKANIYNSLSGATATGVAAATQGENNDNN